MPSGPDDTDDITPQLSQEEAIAIMRGGLGKAELEIVTSYCAPLYWVLQRDSAGNPFIRNATAFFLNAGAGTFGVTACHVVHGWIKDKRAGAGPLCLATNGNPLVLDWDTRVIATHSGIDIATFRISQAEITALGKMALTGYQKTWPPKRPRQNCGIYYCGYPQIGTFTITRHAVSFGAVRGAGVADRVNDRDVVCQFDRKYWLPDPILGAPPPNFDFGGISGGIMLTIIQNQLRSWTLSGVIYEGPSTSDKPGEAIADFEILRARQARFLFADGKLDTALWFSLGGSEHVDP